MNTVDVLKAAKAKIENPEHWCQGRNSIWRSGVMSYCADGAMAVVCGGIGTAIYREAYSGPLMTAANELCGKSPIFLNDNSDHPTVMKMFDRAIALAGGEG